jgi:hypothetical protein
VRAHATAARSPSGLAHRRSVAFQANENGRAEAREAAMPEADGASQLWLEGLRRVVSELGRRNVGSDSGLGEAPQSQRRIGELRHAVAVWFES